MTWPARDSLQATDLAILGTLQPKEVLYDYEGPCIFTSKLPSGILVLAYLSEDMENDQRLRFIVAATSVSTVDGMKSGAVSVREALERGSLWLVEMDYAYHPRDAFSVSLENLPDDAPRSLDDALARA